MWMCLRPFAVPLISSAYAPEASLQLVFVYSLEYIPFWFPGRSRPCDYLESCKLFYIVCTLFLSCFSFIYSFSPLLNLFVIWNFKYPQKKTRRAQWSTIPPLFSNNSHPLTPGCRRPASFLHLLLTPLPFQVPCRNPKVSLTPYFLLFLRPVLGAVPSEYITNPTAAYHLHCCHYSPSCHPFPPGLFFPCPLAGFLFLPGPPSIYSTQPPEGFCYS